MCKKAKQYLSCLPTSTLIFSGNQNGGHARLGMVEINSHFCCNTHCSRHHPEIKRAQAALL